MRHRSLFLISLIVEGEGRKDCWLVWLRRERKFDSQRRRRRRPADATSVQLAGKQHCFQGGTQTRVITLDIIYVNMFLRIVFIESLRDVCTLNEREQRGMNGTFMRPFEGGREGGWLKDEWREGAIQAGRQDDDDGRRKEAETGGRRI